MLHWIFEDEEYTALYHQYFAEFLSSVDIQGIIDSTYQLIKPYVEKDPTAFYTVEEFELGVQTLRQFCEMRSESISMQLENGETTEDMDYVDASGISLSNMGSMDNLGSGTSDSEGSAQANEADIPEGVGPSGLPGSFSGSPPELSSDASGSVEDTDANRPTGGNGQGPGGDFSFDRNGTEVPASELSGWIWIAASAAILGAGLVIAKRYQR